VASPVPGTESQHLADGGQPQTIGAAIDAVDSEYWPGGVMALPPLPEPDHPQLRTEAGRGWWTILGTSTMCAAFTVSPVFTSDGLSEGICWLLVGLIGLFAIVAVFCQVRITYGDPGVIHRSPENCFPLPDEVARRLRNGESLEMLSNLIDEGGRSFCVRCLVWRPPKGTSLGAAHHCRTCQRCVVNFDHHCGVLGRCIAGPKPKVAGVLLGWVLRLPMKPAVAPADTDEKYRDVRVPWGNMTYFFSVIAMGWFGTMTALSALIIGAIHSSAPALYILSVVGGGYALGLLCNVRQCFRACNMNSSCRRAVPRPPPPPPAAVARPPV